jgi:hypothetical protein
VGDVAAHLCADEVRRPHSEAAALLSETALLHDPEAMSKYRIAKNERVLLRERRVAVRGLGGDAVVARETERGEVDGLDDASAVARQLEDPVLCSHRVEVYIIQGGEAQVQRDRLICESSGKKGREVERYAKAHMVPPARCHLEATVPRRVVICEHNQEERGKRVLETEDQCPRSKIRITAKVPFRKQR